MLNQILAGHYRVIRTLGEGGCGKTYIAEDLHRPGHPQCVVKYLKPMSDDPNFLPTARRLFQKEAEILEKLGQHDQIPRLLAYFEHNREFYLVQELIDGLTLNTELPPGHRWSESKFILFLKDVLSILEFVHSYGVIHRDIKPSNLIRRYSDGRIVLIDFGAVKQILGPITTEETSLKHGTISIGTQGYMPTEQARGRPRLNSDLYALGMVSIQALTGVNPLQLAEDADGEVIWQDQAKISAELATILSQMVRYHFRDRYQSSNEVLQDLQPLIGQDFSGQSTTSKRKQTQPEETSETTLPKTKVIILEAEKLNERERFPESPVTPLPETKVILESIPLPETRIIPEISHSEPSPTLLPETKVTPEAETLDKREGFPESPVTPLPETKVILIGTDAPLKKTGKPLKKNPWLIGGGIVAVLASISLMGSYGYSYWLAWRALEQTRSLETAMRYEECVQQAKALSSKYPQLHTEAQELTGNCLLAQEKLAWQETIKKYQQGNFNEAIASAKMIPKTSPLSSQVEKALQKWQQELKDNETHLEASRQALNSKQWTKAIEEALKVSNHPYWQKQTKPILDQANSEIARSEQGKVIRENIKPKTLTVRPSQSKTLIVRNSQSKTLTVRNSQSKISKIRTSQSKISKVRPSQPNKQANLPKLSNNPTEYPNHPNNPTGHSPCGTQVDKQRSCGE